MSFKVSFVAAAEQVYVFGLFLNTYSDEADVTSLETIPHLLLLQQERHDL